MSWVRNVQVQKVQGRNVLGVKRPGKNTGGGAKRPGPKSPLAKRPWFQTSRSKKSGGETS